MGSTFHRIVAVSCVSLAVAVGGVSTAGCSTSASPQTVATTTVPPSPFAGDPSSQTIADQLLAAVNSTSPGVAVISGDSGPFATVTWNAPDDWSVAVTGGLTVDRNGDEMISLPVAGAGRTVTKVDPNVDRSPQRSLVALTLVQKNLPLNSLLTESSERADVHIAQDGPVIIVASTPGPLVERSNLASVTMRFTVTNHIDAVDTAVSSQYGDTNYDITFTYN
jgi:hypothetical protein